MVVLDDWRMDNVSPSFKKGTRVNYKLEENGLVIGNQFMFNQYNLIFLIRVIEL